MNVGKLLAVIDILLLEYEKTDLNQLQDFRPLEKTADSDIYKISEYMIAKTKRTKEKSRFSPSQVRVLEEIGNAQYTVGAFEDKIGSILAGSESVSDVDTKELRNYLIEVQKFYRFIYELKSTFEKIGIAKDELHPGEAEIGVGIPPKQGTLTLGRLRDEARGFERALRTFSEVAGETIESPKLRVVSSTWFEFFMVAGPAAAFMVATTIERIVNLYKNKLEIEKLRKELGKQNVPKSPIKQIEKHEKELVRKGLNELAESFLNEHYKGTVGRKNELHIALNKSMYFLADRIDHGISIEVAVRKLEPPKRKRGEKQTQAQAKEMKAYKEQKKMAETINRLGYTVAELDPARKPILMLPPQKEEPKITTKKKAKVKVKKKAKVKVKKKVKVKVKKKVPEKGTSSDKTLESDAD